MPSPILKTASHFQTLFQKDPDYSFFWFLGPLVGPIYDPLANTILISGPTFVSSLLVTLSIIKTIIASMFPRAKFTYPKMLGLMRPYSPLPCLAHFNSPSSTSCSGPITLTSPVQPLSHGTISLTTNGPVSNLHPLL